MRTWRTVRAPPPLPPTLGVAPSRSRWSSRCSRWARSSRHGCCGRPRHRHPHPPRFRPQRRRRRRPRHPPPRRPRAGHPRTRSVDVTALPQVNVFAVIPGLPLDDDAYGVFTGEQALSRPASEPLSSPIRRASLWHICHAGGVRPTTVPVDERERGELGAGTARRAPGGSVAGSSAQVTAGFGRRMSNRTRRRGRGSEHLRAHRRHRARGCGRADCDGLRLGRSRDADPIGRTYIMTTAVEPRSGTPAGIRSSISRSNRRPSMARRSERRGDRIPLPRQAIGRHLERMPSGGPRGDRQACSAPARHARRRPRLRAWPTPPSGLPRRLTARHLRRRAGAAVVLAAVIAARSRCALGGARQCFRTIWPATRSMRALCISRSWC